MAVFDIVDSKALLRMIMMAPDCYLMEYAKAMKTKYGVNLSDSYLSAFLSRKNISRKRVIELTFLLTVAY